MGVGRLVFFRSFRNKRFNFFVYSLFFNSFFVAWKCLRSPCVSLLCSSSSYIFRIYIYIYRGNLRSGLFFKRMNEDTHSCSRTHSARTKRTLKKKKFAYARASVSARKTCANDICILLFVTYIYRETSHANTSHKEKETYMHSHIYIYTYIRVKHERHTNNTDAHNKSVYLYIIIIDESERERKKFIIFKFKVK